MNTNYSENNHLVLIGKVVSEKSYSHEIYGEKFYVFNLEVVRLSSTVDIIPITVSERLLTGFDLKIGKKVVIEGQFRSYNNYENEEEEKDEVTNEVVLIGYVCKKPIYRQTPFGREIADVLLAVNRAYNKSDYIPSIAWGRNARFCQNMEVGTEVKVTGRVQSRTYEKKFEDGTTETRVAYEVSIASMEIVNNEESEKQEEVV